MVEKARKTAERGARSRPVYLKGEAENLPMFQDETVDLVTAGELAAFHN
jgi:ubiquinone/menaquinone biosynthesis C-methylase UbiE